MKQIFSILGAGWEFLVLAVEAAFMTEYEALLSET